MSRRDLLAQISASIGSYDLWGDLNRRITRGEVVPIISNSVINNRLFTINDDGQLILSRDVTEETEAYHFMVDEQLAGAWANLIKYPLAESPFQLPRVAQYNQVKSRDNSEAKTNYLTFLKLYLLQLALDDEDAADVADTLVKPLDGLSFPEIAVQLADYSFAEIVFQLGYPRFAGQEQNPLYLLAQLPLPVYVTTSHHDFIERALVEAGKFPRLQVCSWSGETLPPEWFGDPPGPEADLQAEPAEGQPIVYHLYGLEKYPTSLVISEDDYLDFLVKVSEDRNSIPLGLRRAIGKSSLLLLGYRLRDWDFRALFRGLIKTSKLQQANFAIQLDPHVPQAVGDEGTVQSYLKEAQRYLQAYFEPANFKVEWYSTNSFCARLVQKWRESQK